MFFKTFFRKSATGGKASSALVFGPFLSLWNSLLRGELDENQEINYPPVMKALLDINYKGFVGQEFIPTGDPLAGLRQAVELCDV